METIGMNGDLLDDDDETSSLLPRNNNVLSTSLSELSDLSGLSTTQVADRVAMFGLNSLPDTTVPLWRQIVGHLFMTPISIIIWLAILVSGLVQDWIDFGLVLFLQIGNTVLSFVEQGKGKLV
jgi:magnesium-transporting ATPase (P-type)